MNIELEKEIRRIKGCEAKKRFETIKAVRKFIKRTGFLLKPYGCRRCGGFHTTKLKPGDLKNE